MRTISDIFCVVSALVMAWAVCSKSTMWGLVALWILSFLGTQSVGRRYHG